MKNALDECVFYRVFVIISFRFFAHFAFLCNLRHCPLLPVTNELIAKSNLYFAFFLDFFSVFASSYAFISFSKSISFRLPLVAR